MAFSLAAQLFIYVECERFHEMETEQDSILSCVCNKTLIQWITVETRGGGGLRQSFLEVREVLVKVRLHLPGLVVTLARPLQGARLGALVRRE